MALPFVDVVAGLLFEDGKFLIAQRHPRDSNGGKWEFPGGKVEAGETYIQALERELHEELSIRVKVNGLIGVHEFETTRARYKLTLYGCKRISGNIRLTEHSDFAWIKESDIDNYQFLSGDEPFLAKITSLGIEALSKI